MNIIDEMFKAVSDMTGGILTDVSSVLVAMVALIFLTIGLDFVCRALNSKTFPRSDTPSINDSADKTSRDLGSDR